MPVLVLLVTLVASLALAPVDANCAGDCEARYGTGRRPLTLATGSPGELGLLSALADVFAPREDASSDGTGTGKGSTTTQNTQGSSSGESPG